MKHVKFWEMTGKNLRLFHGRSCAWASTQPQDTLSATFLPRGLEASISQIAVANEVPLTCTLAHCVACTVLGTPYTYHSTLHIMYCTVR
jgi:hypothetical protein